MEIILHYIYVVAIKDSYALHDSGARVPAWQGDTPAELAMISFWNLIIVWLKVACDISFCTSETQLSCSSFSRGVSSDYGL